MNRSRIAALVATIGLATAFSFSNMGCGGESDDTVTGIGGAAGTSGAGGSGGTGGTPAGDASRDAALDARSDSSLGGSVQVDSGKDGSADARADATADAVAERSNAPDATDGARADATDAGAPDTRPDLGAPDTAPDRTVVEAGTADQDASAPEARGPDVESDGAAPDAGAATGEDAAPGAESEAGEEAAVEAGASDGGVDGGGVDSAVVAACDTSSTMACLGSRRATCFSCAQENGCLSSMNGGVAGLCEDVPGSAPACQDLLGTSAAPTETEVCLRTLRDIFGSGCASDGPETPCLCGLGADPSACMSGSVPPDGPLDPVYQCDLGPGVTTILQNFTQPTLGAGMANAILQCTFAFGCDCAL